MTKEDKENMKEANSKPNSVSVKDTKTTDVFEEAESEASKVPITIDPEDAKFSNAGGKSEHMVVNFTTKRMALKIRCGNPLFRVEPTHMIIEPNKCRQLTINRMPGPIQKDKAIVQYMDVDKDVQDPKAAFKAADAANQKIPHIKIKLVAAAAGGPKLSREMVDE